MHRSIAVIVALFGIVATTAANAQSRAKPAAPACALFEIASGKVAAIHDGRTIVLDDGREVRLAAIEVPGIQNSAGMSAKQALEALVLGQNITLKGNDGADVALDRYGRTVAHVFASSETSVQSQMLATGYARVSAQAGGCAGELLATEKSARTNRLGLWADATFAPAAAAQPAQILAQKGKFALVEGQVVSVRESGALIYINFGRRYTRDFTVTILKRNQRMFLGAGIDPKTLEGRRIRVRGVIEQRGGPVLEAARPEQIEWAN